MREVRLCFEVAGQAALLTDLAMVALPAVAADALVYADFVDAGASVAARVALAVVDVWGLNRREKCEIEYLSRRDLSRLVVRRILWNLVLLSWQ